MLTAAGVLVLAVWLGLLLGRGRFWRAGPRLDEAPAPAAWPAVAAVVPARNEAEIIGRTLPGVLAQDYPGPFTVVLADDQSEDGTGGLAAELARAPAARHPLTVVRAAPRPPGWAGKVWAMAEGLRAAPETPYLLFTDADIAHQPWVLRALVARAERDRLDLVSVMAVLDAGGAWPRLLVPAFVFFFQMLYPFAWAADPRRRTAAAAGGCVLLRRAALARAGGLEAIRGALIDDVALATAVKRAGGRLWLGLSPAVRSLRPNRTLSDVWRMVARSAYTQLRHSPLLLLGTLLGLAFVYAVPPLLALTWPLHGASWAAASGLAAWLLMAAAFGPMLRFYGQSPALGLLLPVAAFVYGLMTADSALAHWRGRGGSWKGRVYAAPTGREGG